PATPVIYTLSLQTLFRSYLSEPLYVSREWQMSSVPVNRSAVPCTIAYEGVREGVVPHYLPGQNPFVEETTKLWGIPLEAVQGGRSEEHRSELQSRRDLVW